MGSTTSIPISQSSVVNTNPILCKHTNCNNRVGFGKMYCTIHDTNTGQPKEEKIEDDCIVCCCGCCMSMCI